MTFQSRPPGSPAVRLAGVLAFLALGVLGWWQQRQHAGAIPSAPSRTAPTTSAPAPRATSGERANDRFSVTRAWSRQAQDVTVEDRGTVVKLLPDDHQGSPHQRFLVRVDAGPTVLFAHNTDLAPRVEPLAPGDVIAFRGEYVWNPKGGVVHWTHRDPGGRHAAGWIEVDGRRFE